MDVRPLTTNGPRKKDNSHEQTEHSGWKSSRRTLRLSVCDPVVLRCVRVALCVCVFAGACVFILSGNIASLTTHLQRVLVPV